MADENKPGGLQSARQFVAAHADALKAGVIAAVKEKATDIREVIGPERIEPVTQPERPFGRDEAGEDVKRVVWTGHTVKTSEGEAYFGAAGLTQGGYYRAAEVQVYGPDELWRWQGERHTDKEHAIASAQEMCANRLRGEEARAPVPGEAQSGLKEVFERDAKEQFNMAELPAHVKAEAEKAAANVNRAEVKMADAGPPVNDRADPYDSKAMEAQREQQRQNALDRKAPVATPEPGRG